MQRLHSVNVESAQGKTKELFNKVENAFGVIPNTVKVMANSPAVLESFLNFSSSMSELAIGEKLHNQVKLSTSESNSCDYCTSLLCFVAPTAGLSTEDILSGRTGYSENEKIQAGLKFAEQILEKKGKLDDEELEAVKQAGFSDEEIVEIVASVVLGCFTNFLNNLADTELDIPKAEPVQACSTEESSSCSTHESHSCSA